MKKLLIISLLLTSTPTLAQPILTKPVPVTKSVNFIAGGWSKHFKERKGNKPWNETHDNLGLEFEWAKDKKWSGYVSHEQFTNSFNDDGTITQVGTKRCTQNRRACGVLGVAKFTGYKNIDVTPIVAAEVVPFEALDRLSVRLAVLPPVPEQGNKTAVAFAGLKFKAMEW